MLGCSQDKLEVVTVKEALEILIAKMDQQALDQPETEASTILRQWLDLDCKTPRKDDDFGRPIRKNRRDFSTPRRGIGIHSNADLFKGK